MKQKPKKTNQSKSPDKQGTNNVQVSKFSRFRWKKKYTYVLIVLFIIFAVAYVFMNKENQPSQQKTSNTTQPCLQSLRSISYEEALVIIEEIIPEKSQKIIDEIKAIDTHKEDVDCLYVLTLANVRLARLEQSRMYLDQLNQVLASQQLSDDVLFANGPSVEALAQEVEFLDMREKEQQANTFYCCEDDTERIDPNEDE